jgi:pentatricopeptide repeat protein
VLISQCQYYYVDKLYIFEEYKPLMQSGDTAVVTWGVIIRAYSIHGQGQEALQLFHEMQESGSSPNEHIYLSILSVIADLGNLQEGQQLHAQLKVLVKFNHYQYLHFTGEVWRYGPLSYNCCKFTHFNIFKVW